MLPFIRLIIYEYNNTLDLEVLIFSNNIEILERLAYNVPKSLGSNLYIVSFRSNFSISLTFNK